MRSLTAALAAALLLLAGAVDAPAARQGGTITVASVVDFVDTDCGKAYYQYDYMLCYATQRPLYSHQPGVGLVPDLAEALPEIGDGGRTITIRIRSGVRFSPPVDRDVTSADVKYALERLFFRSVANGYAAGYLGEIAGARLDARPGRRIRGIQTPDDRTLVIRLKRSTAALAAGALVLPGSAPIPREHALRHDRRRRSAYARHQVATGPYMIGRRRPGLRTTVVRNPSWSAATDHRPAPLDGFTFETGHVVPDSATERIRGGTGLVSGDWSVPPAAADGPGQLATSYNGAFRYVAMNTRRRPFRDVNVRRAVIAAFDREAMRRSRGGELTGDVATHFIPPGIPGFEEAGGAVGPPLDYLANPRGDMAAAEKYLKAAGYGTGRYRGRPIRMIGVDSGVGERAAKVAARQFRKLGFRVRLKLVAADTMYVRYCQRPRSGYDVCPNVAWGKDFDDPQTELDVPFNGDRIVREGNSNHALFDNPAVNAAMDRAALLVDPAERARAWGEIDRRLMERAAAIPWLWDKQTAVASPDVDAVLNPFTSNWDMSFTGLR